MHQGGGVNVNVYYWIFLTPDLYGAVHWTTVNCSDGFNAGVCNGIRAFVDAGRGSVCVTGGVVVLADRFAVGFRVKEGRPVGLGRRQDLGLEEQ